MRWTGLKTLMGRRVQLPALLTLWLVQAPLMYALPAVVITNSWKQFADIPDHLVNAAYAGEQLIIITFVCIAQFAITAPIRRPDEKSDRATPTFLRLASSAITVGVLVSAAATAIGAWLWTAASGQGVNDATGVKIAAALCPVTAIPVYLVLRRRWRQGVGVEVSLLLAGAMVGLLVSAAATAFLAGVELMGLSVPNRSMMVGLLVMPCIAWGVATPFLWSFARNKPPETMMARLANRLFIGSLVEGIAILPLDVMVRRKASCYCGEGTFFSLITLSTVALLCLGPAVLLVPAARRRQRLIDGCCRVCGYDMTATRHLPACPECGSGWRESDSSAAT
ncbi:MAG: hypothetical protein WC718_09535 [Phycisphaerales bacterium]|jgi:hypothetical protein